MQMILSDRAAPFVGAAGLMEQTLAASRPTGHLDRDASGSGVRMNGSGAFG
jgi:hypothetical protein